MKTYCPECFSWGAHTHGCPAAPEVKPIHKCAVCGDGIFEGDRYKDFGDYPMCYGCLQALSPEELLEMVGDPITITKGEEQ